MTNKFRLWFAVSCILLSGTQTSFGQGMTTTSGSHIVFNGNLNLVINNSGLRMNGSISPSTGTISLTGNAATANSFIGGTGSITLYNLQLNKSANGMMLTNSIAVAGTISFTSGDSLFLNGYNIDLGTTGTLSGESGNSRITGETGGYVQVTATLNAPSWSNPGNIGLAINSGANLGITTIKRYPAQQGGLSIKRYFDAIASNNSALNASLRLYYFHEELSGNLETNLGLFESEDGGTTWTNFSYDATNYTTNYIEKNGISTLHRFTLSDISAALPLKLLYFKGYYKENTAILEWSCTGDNSSTIYTLERSTDGIEFQKVTSVPGKKNVTNSYRLFDDIKGMNTLYYRIKIKNETHISYSQIVNITPEIVDHRDAKWGPNPANSYSDLYIYSERAQIDNLSLTDINGKFHLSTVMLLNKGWNTIRFDLSKLPSGIYFIRSKNFQKLINPLVIHK